MYIMYIYKKSTFSNMKNVSPTFRLENVRPVIRFPLVRFFAMGAPRANVLLLGMFSLFGFRDFRGIDLPKLMRVKPAACGSSAGGGGVTPAPRPAPPWRRAPPPARKPSFVPYESRLRPVKTVKARRDEPAPSPAAPRRCSHLTGAPPGHSASPSPRAAW